MGGSHLLKNAPTRRNPLLFSPRAGAHVGAIARIVAVHAALGGDDDYAAADLDGAGLTADRDGAQEGAVLRVVALDGAVSEKHGDRLAVAPDIEGIVDRD